MSEAYSQR